MPEIWYAVLAAVFVVYALIATRLDSLHVTGPMLFLALGVVAARLGLQNPLGVSTGSTSLLLTTLTLTLLLFSDASTIRLDRLRSSAGTPMRLLLIGLPLTVVAGLLVARGLLPFTGIGMPMLVATILAPTDVSLGLAMFHNEQVPSAVRRSINVESGLNDGLAAPFVALAIAVVLAEAQQISTPILDAAVEIAFGALGGVVIGVAGGALLLASSTSRWSSRASRAFGTLGLAVLCYLAAQAMHGNGFVAAFSGGLAFGAVVRDRVGDATEFAEQTGTLLSLAVWFIFGLAVEPILFGSAVGWQPVLYAVLSLTVLRMVPVAIALLGSGLHGSTNLFMGWFGPRGLASVIFLVHAVSELRLEGIDTGLLLSTAGWTVVLSVILHGVSAAPVAEWYAKRSVSFVPGSPELESDDTGALSLRLSWSQTSRAAHQAPPPAR